MNAQDEGATIHEWIEENKAAADKTERPAFDGSSESERLSGSNPQLADPSSWRREHTDIPDRTFPLNVFHIRESDPDMFCIPPHWHEHLEWVVVLKGRFSMQIGATFRELESGSCLFVNTAELHSAFPLEPGSELYALVFGEALLRNHALDHTETRYIRPLLEGRLGLPSFYEGQGAVGIREQLLEVVKEHQEARPGFELLIKAGLLSVLGLALRQSETPAEHAAKSGRHAESAVYPLLLHLSEHFREPIGVREAAKICCITPTYFCHVFKRTTGKTLSEYVNTLRIHEAESLLRSSGRSVQEVARLVGYGDPGYFARVFKKFKGMAPRQYAEVNGLSNLSATQTS